MGMTPSLLWEKLFRDIMRSCTHVVALNEFGEELARSPIIERFMDNMPAPYTFKMMVQTQRRSNRVSMYLFREHEAVNPITLYAPMYAGPGDEIRLAFEGCSVTGA